MIDRDVDKQSTCHVEFYLRKEDRKLVPTVCVCLRSFLAIRVPVASVERLFSKLNVTGWVIKSRDLFKLAQAGKIDAF